MYDIAESCTAFTLALATPSLTSMSEQWNPSLMPMLDGSVFGGVTFSAAIVASRLYVWSVSDLIKREVIDSPWVTCDRSI